jgi:hypothetical protein
VSASDIFAYVVLIVGIVGFYFIWKLVRGFDPKGAAEENRRYFDEHGHWPDQTPEEAEAERRELARVYAPSQSDDDGTV